MINLTFGEQVKIILSRKDMTIKELAEAIEARTGKKMSRQNLTQRLSRDNFQEQDMRMIAGILGCSFQLSILATVEAEKASVIEDIPPTGRELEKLLEKKEHKEAKAKAKREAERDLTVGEFVDMIGETTETAEEMEELPEETVEQPVVEEAAAEESAEVIEAMDEAEAETTDAVPEAEAEPEVSEAESPEVPEAEAFAEVPQVEEPEAAAVEEEPGEVVQAVVEEKKESALDKITKIISAPKRKEFRQEVRKDFQPIKQRADVEEDKVQGDVNPYTGHEYQSNSVRTHPNRIGYVQVYDRKEHKWTDMTEWAFLGFEERKKVTLGKDYEPPIYLD